MEAGQNAGAGRTSLKHASSQRRLDGMSPTRSGSGFFDAWSLVYDFPLVQLATYRPVHNAVLRALEHSRVILDVGCGTGQLTARIKETRARARVVGCDFSSGMLHRGAHRRGAIGWVRGDAARLPFADEVFDAVVSTEAYHWFPDQERALAEMRRVLVPSGRLLLAMVNPPVRAVSTAFNTGSRLLGRPFYWPTPGELRTQLEAAGFVVVGQRRIFRLAGMLLPPMLTSATKPRRGSTTTAGPRSPSAS